MAKQMMEQPLESNEVIIDLEEALASITMNAGTRCGHPTNRGARLRFAAIKPHRAHAPRYDRGASRQELRLNAVLRTVEPAIGKILVSASAIVDPEDTIVVRRPERPHVLVLAPKGKEKDALRTPTPAPVAPAPKAARKPAPRPAAKSGFSSDEIRAFGPGGFSARTTFAKYIPKRG